MAYRPTNNIQENIIHRNTIFDSQGLVSCCTCGYCIEKTEDATLTLTNFKAAEPIINENSIGSTIIEFSDYMKPIPNSSFSGYVLTPSPIPQSTTPTGLADGLIYYPFLNCDGETTQRATVYYPYWPNRNIAYSYWKLPSYQGEKTAYPYGVSVEVGTDGLGLGFDNSGYNLFFNYYSAYSHFNLFYSETYLNKMNYINGSNSGSYDLYLSYMDSHDFSVEGISENNNCSNNIIRLIGIVYYLDVSNHSFPYLHPNYNFVNSILNIYANGSVKTPICNIGSSTLWAFNSGPFGIGNTQIYKGGYVLDTFLLNKDGSFSSNLSIISLNDFQYSEWQEFHEPWNYTPLNATLRHSIPAYNQVMSSTFFENQTLNNYKKNFPFYHADTSYNYDFCGSKDEVFFGVQSNDYFFYVSPNQPAPPLSYTASKTNRTKITSATDSSGKTTLTIKNVLWTGKTLLTNNYAYNSIPIVTISGGGGTGATAYATINAAVGKVSLVTILSSGSGYTSAPIVSFSGGSGAGVIAYATISGGKVTSIIITNQGSGYTNTPRLSSGTIPLNYQAILKGGFESDIIVSFQSVPYCQLINLPDKLKRVTEIKVNLENYEKVPQYNMINYDMALKYFQDTPLIGDPYNIDQATEELFNNFMVQMAFPNNGMYKQFENIAFLPPNVNANNEFFVRKGTQLQGLYFTSIQKDIVAIDPPVLTSYSAKAGRAYPDFGVADRFKSCLLINGDKDVWKTGNEVQFVGLDYLVTDGGSGYTSVPTVTLSSGGGTGATAKAAISNGRVVSVTVLNKGKNYTSNKTVVISGGGGSSATAVDISFTPFYSIYMEEIKDEKQTAGQSLIRIARTLQDANDGIYIPNIGLETLYKDKSLSVKFLYGYKDVSIENLPRYENVNPNNIDQTNINADILGASYSTSGSYPTLFNSQFDFYFAVSGSSILYNYLPLSIKFSMPKTFPDIPIYLSNFETDSASQNFEIISLSPLKIKYPKMKFCNVSSYYPITNISVTFPWSNVQTNPIGALFFGFQCDVIIEEFVDEFIEEALPIEFNQILENVEYIQTSNLMNSRTPMQMINPEQCEHIGKVIDRKNCNCPKKWVRLCDVHGKTDWKKCMQCKDFKVSE